jgi:hypothetical protein
MPRPMEPAAPVTRTALFRKVALSGSPIGAAL